MPPRTGTIDPVPRNDITSRRNCPRTIRHGDCSIPASVPESRENRVETRKDDARHRGIGWTRFLPGIFSFSCGIIIGASSPRRRCRATGLSGNGRSEIMTTGKRPEEGRIRTHHRASRHPATVHRGPSSGMGRPRQANVDLTPAGAGGRGLRRREANTDREEGEAFA